MAALIDGSQIYVSLNAMLLNGLDIMDAKAIIEITHKFPTLRGMQITVYSIQSDEWYRDMIYLTRYASETDHVCRTISHEIIHTIVDRVDGIRASIALDREMNGLSLLDRLMRDGYLGDE